MYVPVIMASQVAPVVKNPPANAGEARHTALIPGSARAPGGGNGNPLQYSSLENPMDCGAWRATVRGVAKSRTRLKQHARVYNHKADLSKVSGYSTYSVNGHFRCPCL